MALEMNKDNPGLGRITTKCHSERLSRSANQGSLMLFVALVALFVAKSWLCKRAPSNAGVIF